MNIAKTAFRLCLSFALAAGVATNAHAADVGAGTGILGLPAPNNQVDTPSDGANDQSRTNIDDSFTLTLGPGTYEGTSWSYHAGQTGSVIPFLAVSTGADTYEYLSVGSQVDVDAGGLDVDVTVPFGGSAFTLASSTELFAGIVNPPVAGSQNPIYTNLASGSTVDHNNNAEGDITAQSPPVAGLGIDGLNHTNLARSYAFSIDVQEVVANASITWDAVDTETTASDLIGGPTIPFVAATYPGGGNAGGNDDGSTSGNFFTSGGGDTGNEGLNEVLNSHGWKGGTPAAQIITLDGLTAGEDYRIQVLAAGDTRGCCNTRTQTADDLVGSISGEMTRGDDSVVGTFTATSATQEIEIAGGQDPGLSGYILTRVTAGRADGEVLVEALNYGFGANGAGMPSTVVTVPEPNSVALLLVASLSLLMGRRRR